MQPEKLLILLQNPHHIVPKDVQMLQNLLQPYPYFQIAYTLLAKAAYDQNPSRVDPSVQLAAVYATDRPHLKTLLERNPPLTAVREPKRTSTTTHQATKSPQLQANASAANPMKAIQQSKQHVITKQGNSAQLDKIQVSLQRHSNYKFPSLQDPPVAGQVDLTHKSTTFHDDLATETLAQILWQQGKPQRALAIYEKLLLKFPKKKDYFAPIIEKLKTQASCSHC